MTVIGDCLVNAGLRSVIAAARLFPPPLRVPIGGTAMAKLIAPCTDMRARIMDNLALIYPDMAIEQRRTIMHGCLDNFGRLLLENYSVQHLRDRAAAADIVGPGHSALEAAHREGRPAVLVSGHFGNFQAVRARLVGEGYPLGCMYRPMNNRFFNRHYVRSVERIGQPAFPLTQTGLRGAMRLLKEGGSLALLNDQHSGGGEVLDFMGHPALTNIQAARMAITCDALLVPCYGIRKSNGLDFTIRFEAPVPLTDPIAATQALNESLEAQIRARPEQWYWLHRRWKPVG